MNVRFTSAVYRELTETAEYCEGKQPGLAHRFLSEVEVAVRSVRHTVPAQYGQGCDGSLFRGGGSESTLSASGYYAPGGSPACEHYITLS